jgi:hypothetical protein
MTVYQIKYSSKSGGHRGWSMCDSMSEAKQRIADLKARGYRAWLDDEWERDEPTFGPGDWEPKVRLIQEEVTVAYRAHKD